MLSQNFMLHCKSYDFFLMLIVDLIFGASNFIVLDIEEGEKISEFDANIQKKGKSIPKEMFSQLINE
jgi:hypothetical protein